ncbi:MAG: hypothetical protein ACQESB_02625 [Elusimicrobiota bacterium]
MFEIPARHKDFFVSPPCREWKEMISKNRSDLKSFRPWALGCAHQSSLYGPGVLFREALVNSFDLNRKMHLSCDTTFAAKKEIYIPSGLNLIKLDYYSFKGKAPYARISPVEEKKLQKFINMAPDNEVLRFFEGALKMRMNSENIARMNVAAKQDFLKKYGYRLPQVFLTELLESRMYDDFLKSIYAKRKKFRLIYNEAIENIDFPGGIKKLEENELPLRKLDFLSGAHPKAVLLNIFLRLYVFDLYVQGVGESRYSQASDYVIDKFFGLKPPLKATASFTLYTPARDIDGLKKKLAKEKKELRRMIENPQEFVQKEHEIKELLNKNDSKKNIHKKIVNKKNSMRKMIEDLIEKKRVEVQKLEKILKITSRDYPFFSYGKEDINYLFKKAQLCANC